MRTSAMPKPTHFRAMHIALFLSLAIGPKCAPHFRILYPLNTFHMALVWVANMFAHRQPFGAMVRHIKHFNHRRRFDVGQIHPMIDKLFIAHMIIAGIHHSSMSMSMSMLNWSRSRFRRRWRYIALFIAEMNFLTFQTIAFAALGTRKLFHITALDNDTTLTIDSHTGVQIRLLRHHIFDLQITHHIRRMRIHMHFDIGLMNIHPATHTFRNRRRRDM
mmetsp:Transcript_54241/g.89795  ORF Transcript_54241/g.89795 Transcript_54241/m.89795 type:complete len:218 (-) Transcript_54241:566-1219(-)